MEENSYNLTTLRRHEVVKANPLIQKSRHQFTVQQQKVLLYLISLLKPEQTGFEQQIFDISEFCRVCGIESQQGKNYKDLKSAILGLKNKGFWLTKADGTEVTVSWIDKAEISPKSGKISILLDKDMQPLLLELHEKFTKYQLIYTLAMRSKYAVRLYELLKSYENRAVGSTTVEFDLDWFKNRVGAEYELWYDVQRKVISVAVNEINLVSDILVTYKGVKKGRSFVAIKFFIESKKDFSSQTATERAIYNRLTGKKGKRERSQMAGQLSLDGGEVDE